MESEHKASNDGGNESGRTPINGREKESATAYKSKLDLFFRVAAAVLSLTAAAVLGVDKETTTVAVTLIPLLPAVDVQVIAKWHYLSAFVYFLVANIIACVYATISLLLRLSGKRAIAMMILVFDVMIVALLFSSIGAALAIGIIGYKGNSHVRWQKVCNFVGRFCRQSAAAIGLSCVASLIFFLLVLIGILKLYKKR
ncbi:hypothetical protein CDL12_29360 [Handroanthus impetiginosus]|uniref:CASP-like protein n=1 Tax=Handroanthus impetiginosus TaxID=429701 RepID=A0A2G9FYZ8_9LAMI|nr:hypothetical protein CDL12_29360 [Handroanthus impetiginosus]